MLSPLPFITPIPAGLPRCPLAAVLSGAALGVLAIVSGTAAGGFRLPLGKPSFEFTFILAHPPHLSTSFNILIYLGILTFPQAGVM
jgi:hypothetical protein